jgi:hypothetical protein
MQYLHITRAHGGVREDIGGVRGDNSDDIFGNLLLPRDLLRDEDGGLRVHLILDVAQRRYLHHATYIENLRVSSVCNTEAIQNRRDDALQFTRPSPPTDVRSLPLIQYADL